MKITEIFLSIQGESTRAGSPCLFVRTTGCNLRCTWCDTDYAFYGGRDMTVEEIIEELEKLGPGCDLVELTGGEPLVQSEIGRLSEALLARGYTVLCETSGSLDIDRLPLDVIKIMDIKAPGSGESEVNLWSNLGKLGPNDEIKFVLADRADYDWALKVIAERGLEEREILFSPVWGKLSLDDLAGWILADGAPVRLQTQLHHHIWGGRAAGV